MSYRNMDVVKSMMDIIIPIPILAVLSELY